MFAPAAPLAQPPAPPATVFDPPPEPPPPAAIPTRFPFKEKDVAPPPPKELWFEFPLVALCPVPPPLKPPELFPIPPWPPIVICIASPGQTAKFTLIVAPAPPLGPPPCAPEAEITTS